jgi:N-acetylglucosamine malate deacetylase 1
MSSYGVDVLAFGPHPDDVEIFCGGTLIRLVDLGHSVGVVDLTRGERASNGTPEERAREASAAARVMGLAFRENLGLPDTGLMASDPEQLRRVVDCLRRLRPEIVLVPWLEERHPDHVAAGELLTRAVYFAGVRGYAPDTERHVPRQMLYYALRHRMTPSFVVDTSAAAERKRQAIACYGSQVAGAVPTLLASSRALEALDARDRYFGSMIGVSHGEALRSPNVPGLVDPVRHFRENPFSEAHAFEPLR